MPRAKLAPHGASPSRAVRSVEVQVNRTARGVLNFSYRLGAHLDQLRIPAPATPQRKDELWQHTCFEAFVSMGASGGYYEFNFSPSTEWAMYSFNAYRAGMAAALMNDECVPQLSARRTAKGLELAAAVRLASMPLAPTGLPLRLALAAIIEEAGGKLSYWALNHPSARADFHHPKSFILEI